MCIEEEFVVKAEVNKRNFNAKFSSKKFIKTIASP